MMEVIIRSTKSQSEALLFIKKFKSVMGFKPISRVEDNWYVISINAKDKRKYDLMHKAGRI